MKSKLKLLFFITISIVAMIYILYHVGGFALSQVVFSDDKYGSAIILTTPRSEKISKSIAHCTEKQKVFIPYNNCTGNGSDYSCNNTDIHRRIIIKPYPICGFMQSQRLFRSPLNNCIKSIERVLTTRMSEMRLFNDDNFGFLHNRIEFRKRVFRFNSPPSYIIHDDRIDIIDTGHYFTNVYSIDRHGWVSYFQLRSLSIHQVIDFISSYRLSACRTQFTEEIYDNIANDFLNASGDQYANLLNTLLIYDSEFEDRINRSNLPPISRSR